MATGRFLAASSHANRISRPPVASITISVGVSIARRLTTWPIPASSYSICRVSPAGSILRSNVPLETSIPTNFSTVISLIAPILAKMRAYWPQQPFGLSVRNRRGAPCFWTGLEAQGDIELPHRNRRSVDLWTIRLRRTGTLAVENASRFPPRIPLPTISTDHNSFYIKPPKRNIQGNIVSR